MSAAAVSPSPQKAQPKVLRIGIVREGKVAKELVIRAGDPVSVGASPQCTVEATGPGLPQRFDLFVARNGVYSLNAPDGVDGKISMPDGLRGISEMKEKGEIQKRGEYHALPLTENTKGKIVVGPVTVLFQFVVAPPEPVRALTAADLRPRFFEEDDPLFMGLLGVFGLTAIVFMAWVKIFPHEHTIDPDLVEAAARLVVQKIEKIELPPDVPAESAEPEKEKEPEKPKEEDKSKVVAPAPAKSAQETLAAKNRLFQILGTDGDGTDQRAEDIIGDGGLNAINSALDGVGSGDQVASADGFGIRSGSGGGTGDAKIGIGGTGGGTGTTGSATVKVKPKVAYGTPDLDAESGDANGIEAVVNKKRAAVSTCTEQALKVNPGLNGRVSIGWVIQAGKVAGVKVVANTTGDSALGECVARQVKTMRFAEDLTATVSEYTWIVSGQ